MPGPGMAVYYATKAFVGAFSRALTEELKARAGERQRAAPRRHRDGLFTPAPGSAPAPGRRGAVPSALSVAKAGYRGLMVGRRTIVPGLGNKAAALLLPLIPDAILLPIIYRFQRRRRRS